MAHFFADRIFLLCGLLLLSSSNPVEVYRAAFLDHSFSGRVPVIANPLAIQPPYDALPLNRGLSAAHYPSSNEDRIDLFLPHIYNLQGGYAGVGTDQNLIFIGRARSEFAYLFDFDPAVVGINRIHLFFISISPTPAEFQLRWDERNQAASFALLERRFQTDPDRELVLAGWKIAQAPWKPVTNRLRKLKRLALLYQMRTFLNDTADYEHLRALVINQRIQAIPGDLNGRHSLFEIGRRARLLGRPVRILYLSNAEDYFPAYGDQFALNIRSLPADDISLVLRTCSIQTAGLSHPGGEGNSAKPFHYNMQTIPALVSHLNAKDSLRITDVLRKRRDIRPGFSVSGLPER